MGSGARGGQSFVVVKQKHQFFVAMLCLVDAAVVVTACYVAWLARMAREGGVVVDDPVRLVREPVAYLVVPAVLYAMWGFGLYRPRRDRALVGEAGQIVRSVLIAIAIVVVLLWLTGNALIQPSGPREAVATLFSLQLDASRYQLAVLTPLLIVLLTAERVVFRSALRSLRRRGWNLRHACVVGVGRLGQITCRTLERNSWTGISVAYFVGHRDQTRRTRCEDRPVLGGLDELEDALEKWKVDAVYLALPGSCAAQMPELLKRLERFPVDVRVVPDVTPRHMPQSMAVSQLDGMPILSVRESPLYGLGGVSKRALDIAGALGAGLLFAPLLIVIAALVRLSGPGPVIFRQRRVSLGGEVFDIYKFRTMHHAEDEANEGEPSWTSRRDARITPVGRWLRRTSLDELPQLLNVLMGDMSLVGPRPERPELIERFRDDWRGYMLRQHVKAGMTGWAQVNGLRGDTSLRKRLQYDLFYVRHWSLLFDLRILLMTLSKGFVHRNAH
ncbi:MAG: undecaprenyl-phosphate glucose phosphotransferase [Planctomycetota bacterium]